MSESQDKTEEAKTSIDVEESFQEWWNDNVPSSEGNYIVAKKAYAAGVEIASRKPSN